MSIQIENKEYSSNEIKKNLTTIITHVMSKSAKNNDLANEMARYNSVMTLLVKNEK